MINRVIKPGLAVTAGPNKSSEVRRLSQLMENLKPGIIIFDGALNRIAPIGETDGFILVTGAARNPEIDQLAEETKRIWQIASLPAVSNEFSDLAKKTDKVTLWDQSRNIVKQWKTSSWLSNAAFDDFPVLEGGYTLYIPGIIHETVLEELLKRKEMLPDATITLVFSNAIKLLISGSPQKLFELKDRLKNLGINLLVAKHIPLLAVTVNPFYPIYRVSAKEYQPAYVDAQSLKNKVAHAVAVPVFDIVLDRAEILARVISQKWNEQNF